MTDQREIILARLAVVCAAVTGVASVVRNRLDVSKLQRPAVVILDGSEELVSVPPDGRGLVWSDQYRMALTPVIEVHARDNSGNGGALLSLYRSRLLLAILDDTTLADTVGRNGTIYYQGASVAPPTAEGSEYMVHLAITFTYFLRLSDLAA